MAAASTDSLVLKAVLTSCASGAILIQTTPRDRVADTTWSGFLVAISSLCFYLFVSVEVGAHVCEVGFLHPHLLFLQIILRSPGVQS